MYRQLVFIFLSSCFVLQVAATCTPIYFSQVSCPTFWTAYMNHCYRFFEEPASWLEASKHCGGFGAPNGLGAAHLVTLHSAQEQEVVREIVRQSSIATTAVGIGFTDAAEEGVFKWVDRKTANYLAWFPNVPDNSGGNENCATLNIFHGLWNDVNCETLERPYVCKMRRF